jgi:flagellar biosynthesis protein
MANNDEPHKGLDLVDLRDEPVMPSKLPEKQIAIAVKYEKLTKEAPKIVATGRGAVAEQILQLAFANGVKVREDADLAEVLSHLEIDSPIPLEAYAAVAEILAYVYRVNGERKAL